MGRNILKSSVHNASFSIIFQVLFRCITFVLNAFIIRTVGQDVLGIMNVRLLLLESTILFLSKEPLFKACLTNAKSHNWAQVINMIWISVPISALLGFILVYIWINLLSTTDEIYLQQYKLGCYAIALSCVVEQTTQSAVLVAQSFCFVKLKIVIETIYIISRTIIFVVLVIRYPNSAINAFSIAQISSAVILFFLYYGFFAWYIPTFNRIKENEEDNDAKIKHKDNKLFRDMADFPFRSILNFFPGFMFNEDESINKNLLLLTISFVKQSFIKQILTEGERYVMTISPVLTFSQQSMYDIVNNLGSLAARFIFRPIEESAYFYFTQMIQREESIEKQDQRHIAESANVLSQLCKVVSSIGLLVVAFGQSYSYTLLYLYGGSTLVSTDLPTTLLQCHCFAIVLLAVNGVTEAFAFATMTNKQLDRYNYVMVIFSISFLLLSYILTNMLGPVGFILANCLNMIARITHSIYFIENKYQGTNYDPLKGLVPDTKFVVTLVLSAMVAKFSEKIIQPKSIILHIGLGGVLVLGTLAVWALENRELLKLGYEKYKRKVSIKED